MKVPEFCKVLDDKLASVTNLEETLQLSALSLQQAFKVVDDEIAFLKFDATAESLAFIWPVKLSKSGFIPVHSRDSFAATTVRENKPQLHNRFTSKLHSSVFEQVNLNPETKKKDNDKSLMPGEPKRPRTIQKIMSAPLCKGDDVVGAVQVSRKADDIADAGPDFTNLELEALTAIAKVIGRYI